MMHPIATGFAILASASLAVAGGEGEKAGEGKKPERRAAAPQDRMPAAEKTAVTVKATPGKGITFDMGDQFRLRMKNRLQVQWAYTDFDSDLVPAVKDMNTFDVRRARTSFDGHVWDPTIQYKLQVEWTDAGMAGSPLKDGWIRWEFWKSQDQDTLALRAGQQKTMFGREATGSSEYLEFVDRSIATMTFATSRSVGAILEGSHSAGQFSWMAGAFNSDTAGASAAAIEEGLNGDNELNYTINLRWDPNGPMGWESYSQGDLDRADPLFSLGAGGWWGNQQATVGGGPVQDLEAWMVNLNGAAKWQGWHALAEWFYRNEDVRGPGPTPVMDSSAWGAQGQVSYTMMPAVEDGPQWAFGGRYSIVDQDDTPLILTGNVAAEARINEYSAVVSAYYHQHQLKTQLTYTYQEVDLVGLSAFVNHILQLQFQLVF